MLLVTMNAIHVAQARYPHSMLRSLPWKLPTGLPDKCTDPPRTQKVLGRRCVPQSMPRSRSTLETTTVGIMSKDIT